MWDADQVNGLSVCKGTWRGEIAGIDFHGGRGAHIPKDSFICRDLAEPNQAYRTFDLALSLEVGEHLPSDCAENLRRLHHAVGLR